MFAWLTANLGTIIVCAVLIAVVTLIIIHMVNSKKRGETSCGCGCTDCSMSGQCHQD
ncbi:MAG TPA: FeoB-associated Cys-rich membrane protein [Pseudoflavonifractor sp.]|jgi:hypothetical protein|nr:FeoB-associated Cys-rich membrane protein [Pseudoflavonifractor sp.]